MKKRKKISYKWYFRRFRRRPLRLRSSKKHYLENKNQALEFARERIHCLNKAYGFRFNNISVKNQKTRWGSCSIKGNLNFNYRILLLPSHISDYIIVHEICHLKELNHSKRFWDLVAISIPNYSEIRKELRRAKLN